MEKGNGLPSVVDRFLRADIRISAESLGVWLGHLLFAVWLVLMKAVAVIAGAMQ